MAWNVPNRSDRTGNRSIVRKQKPRIAWWITGLGTFALLVTGGLALLRPDDSEAGVADAVEAPRKSSVAAVPPAPVIASPGGEAPAAGILTDPDARPTRVGGVVNDYVMLPSGRIHRRTGVVTNSATARPKGRYAIFERRSDNEIAAYLSMRPGDVVVGPMRRDGRFLRDFVESLNEPIAVTAEDTPERAQLKRDVAAARQQLKEAMDRGEDIERIMADTRAELQNLMRVKQDMRHLFYEERGKCETERDVEDVLKVCNKILESRGIAPLTYGPITQRNVMRTQENEKL